MVAVHYENISQMCNHFVALNFVARREWVAAGALLTATHARQHKDDGAACPDLGGHACREDNL